MLKTLLVTQMFPPILGGAGNYYYKLCQSLPSDEIAVLAHNTKAFDDNLSGLDFPFTTYHESFFFTSKFIWPKWSKLLWHLAQAVKKEKPDILWAGEAIPAGLAVWMTSKLFRIPYFVSTHGADVLNPLLKKGIKGTWKKTLVDFVLKRAQFVMCNSEYTRLQVSRYGIAREDSIVIYPCATYSPGASKKTKKQENKKTISKIQGLKTQGYKILFTALGHVVKRKGVDSVIEALPKVWNTQEKVVYVITGDGPYKKYLENRVKELDKKIDKKNIQSRIIFTGPVSDEELRGLYNICNIYIMLPRVEEGLIEGFGIVYLEAGSFGKPVIGSKVGGVPEAIVDFYDNNYDEATGLMVNDVHNSNEVAKKILMLLKDEGLAKKLGNNGKIHASKFTWSNETKKLEREIRNLNK